MPDLRLFAFLVLLITPLPLRSVVAGQASAAKPVLSTLLLAAADGQLPSVDAPVKDCGWASWPVLATLRALAGCG